MTGYETPPPSPDSLRRLSEMADALHTAELKQAQIEEELKAATAKVRELAEKDIPELMDEIGLEEFRTKSGFRIKITETIRASIPEAKKPAAFAWLDGEGHGGMIKRSIVVGFNRDDEIRAKALLATLSQQFENVKADLKVEPSTLRAFIREQLEQGVVIPMELFGAWRQRVASIVK